MSFAFPVNFALGRKVGSDQRQNLSLDFQNAIKKGNANLIKNLISEGMSVNKELPNGEIPLHLAVRENQPEIVLALLDQGADPEIKDFQHLTAIDHAVIMGNQNILASILGKRIGTDFKHIQAQIKCQGTALHINQLTTKIQKISSVDVKKITPFSRAAFEGNVEILNELSKETINNLDIHGLAPIHYAILGKQTAVVEKLIELGSKVDMLNREGDSLLHFAAISGSLEIIKILINSGADLNFKNSTETTPLHYAALKENLSVVETFIKAGANPHVLNNQTISPLGLICSIALQKDPLSLPKTQIVILAITSLYWISFLAKASGLAILNEKPLDTLLPLVIDVILNCSETDFFLNNLDKNWKKVIAWTGTLGLAALAFNLINIPSDYKDSVDRATVLLTVGLQAWRTCNIALSSFEGLKKSWRNVGYRNWAVARNVVVHGVSTANSVYNLCKLVSMFHFQLMSEPYKIKLDFIKYFKGEESEAYYQANKDFKHFNAQYFPSSIQDVSKCNKFSPSALIGLSDIERVRNSDLKPECVEDALAMLSKDFTVKTLLEQGPSLYKKTLRNLFLKIHPDKAPQYVDEYRRLTTAQETLAKFVEQYC